MQYLILLIVGSLSFGHTITAVTANGKQDRVKRSFTTTNGLCTAVCKDNLFNDCTVDCATESIAKPTPKAVLPDRALGAVVTVTNNGCTAICWDMMPGTECDIQCGRDFSTHMPVSTPVPTATPVVPKRDFTTTANDCTAVCWDLDPGTGCDVRCRQTGITQLPSGTSSLWGTTFTTGDCTVNCQDLILGKECGFLCTAPYSTGTPVVPTQVALAAISHAREEIQARHAHELRFIRKFGPEARDDNVASTEIVTTASKDYSSTPAILPAIMPRLDSSEVSLALSAISVAMASVSSVAALPPAASGALSEAQSFLSSVSQASISQVSATMASASPASTIIVPTVIPTTAVKTTSTTSTRTSLVPSSWSTTTTQSSTATGPPAMTTARLTGGASLESRSLAGFLIVLLLGLAANVAFMV